MKNEKKKMMQYINQLDNEKMQKTKKASKKITVMLSTVILTVTVIIIVFFCIIASFFYNEIYLVFLQNQEQFVKKLEAMYHQDIEIVEANCDERGNGTYILRTKKEPQIEFHAAKEMYSNFETDYPERALLYYSEKNSLFQDIQVTSSEQTSQYYEDFSLLKTYSYLQIQSYEQLEQASRTLYDIQKFMEEKVEDFSVLICLKIADYTSPVEYATIPSAENGVYQEKYEYYWYLKDTGKDTSVMPAEDIDAVNYPRILDVYANGKRVVDTEESGYGLIIYLTASYNLEKQTYEVNAKKFILGNTNIFHILSENTDLRFSFDYNNRKYNLYYTNDELRGNNIPWISEISYFTELFGAQIEYDFEGKTVNFIL